MDIRFYKLLKKTDWTNLTSNHGKERFGRYIFISTIEFFYVTIENEDVYLLHACRKQKNKTETIDKNIVISGAKELGNMLNKTFI